MGRALSGSIFWSGSCWTHRGYRGRCLLTCGQLLTHPGIQVAAAVGIVPLAGSPHHHAVLTLPRVVGLPWIPVAGTRNTPVVGCDEGRVPSLQAVGVSPSPFYAPHSKVSPMRGTCTWASPISVLVRMRPRSRLPICACCSLPRAFILSLWLSNLRSPDPRARSPSRSL